jgi:hypothetical protein
MPSSNIVLRILAIVRCRDAKFGRVIECSVIKSFFKGILPSVAVETKI